MKPVDDSPTISAGLEKALERTGYARMEKHAATVATLRQIARQLDSKGTDAPAGLYATFHKFLHSLAID